MKNDPEPNAADAPKKKFFSGAWWAGLLAAGLGLSELALYIVYAALSANGPSETAAQLRLPLQLLFVVSVAAGIFALFKRRWICGPVAIVLPALLPLLDWIVRMSR